jgi:hypothetical protein
MTCHERRAVGGVRSRTGLNRPLVDVASQCVANVAHGFARRLMLSTGM